MAMVTNAGELTKKQEDALAALLVNYSIESAAKAAGCDPSTLSVWLNHDPVFKDRLRAAHGARLHAVIMHSVNQLGQSFRVLVDVRDDPKSTPTTRIRAAREIISLHLKAREQGDILGRLEALEEALENVTQVTRI